MIERVKKEINGQQYEFGYLPASFNLALFVKFGSIVGVSLSRFTEAMLKNEYALIAEGVNKILTSIYINDPKCDIVLEIMNQTTRNGIAINKDTYNQFYTGNIEEMLEAFYEAMMVHFKPFLQKILSGFLGLEEKAKDITKITENLTTN
jgi:hypothetical protein